MEIKKVEIKMENGSVLSQPNQSSGEVKRSSRFPFEERKPYYLKPLRIEKNYIFTHYFHKESNEEINMRNVESVEVTYYSNEKGIYTLFHETEEVYDMGLATTLYNYYIQEEFKGIPVKVYLTDIIERGCEVLVKDLNPPKF